MADDVITMLQIPPKDGESPWADIFYMCGRCGHAIKLRDVEKHALEAHQANGVNLYTKVEEANERQTRPGPPASS
jgi:hypothetical protein